MLKRSAALFVCFFATTFAASTSDAAPAKEEAITIATIVDPPEDAGIDMAALREATLDAIHSIDPKEIRRPVSVSLVLIKTSNDPTASCVINVAVQDRKKGTILGTAAGSASASTNSHGDQRARVTRIALANAISRVPDVIPSSR